MNSTLKLLKSTFSCFLLFLLGLILSGFWASYSVPSLITLIEKKIGHTISYELHLRLYLAAIFALILLFYLFYSLLKKNRLHLFLSLLLMAAYAILPIIFIFDLRHSIIEEFSWIRYPSSLALILAGLAFFLISRRFNKGEKWPGKDERAWLILSAGFVFAGVDEVAEIHEKIGYGLEKLFSLVHVTTDLITVFYFIIGLAVLIWLAPAFIKTAGEKSKFFNQVSLFTILLFGLACFFDTFDGVILTQLRHFTDFLANRGHFFSDAWYIFYEPKKILNSLEEIFEYLAGVLFFSAGLILLKELIKSKHQPSPFSVRETNKKSSKIVLILTFLFLLGLISPFFFSRMTVDSSPLENNGRAELIASVRDGLFHSDDLTYDEKWGIVLANESENKRIGGKTGTGIFTFQNGEFKKLVDPQKLLADIDSVTADESGIFASDGAEGKIFRYQNKKEGFVEFANRKNGLKTPEGLSIVDQDLLILDEGEKTISKLNLADQKIVVDYPRHPLFQAPEGIAYHPGLKAFLITDDKTGTIFKYNFGQKIEVWANKKVGLKAPEDLAVSLDEDIYVTDNGRGEVVIFSQDGKIKKTIRFRPLFRDLQGITLDREGNIFVVTADSYGSASFVPSCLWKISQTP